MALQGLRGLGSSAARRSGGLSAYGRTPEEAEESLLAKLGGMATSGLATIGNLLDLPGSMVRDVIGGVATGDWNRHNPFDQWLTPTRDDNRTTGREVLERTFGMRKNRETGIGGWFDDPGEGLRDVAGFGAEVLLDPASYLTFGGSALTKTGKVAQKAGLTPFIREAGKNAGKGIRRARTTLGLDDVLRATGDEARYMDQLRAAIGGKNTPRSSVEMLAGRDPRATLISSQDVLYPEKVDEYLRSGANQVELSPVLNIGGQRFQMVMDGHHRLEAARRAGIDPEFVVPDLGKLGPEQAAFSYPTLNRLMQGKITPEDFIEKMRVDDAYRDVLTGKPVTIPDAAQGARQAEDALQALLKTNEPLGYTVGVGLPFGPTLGGSNLGAVGRGYNRLADRFGGAVRGSAPVRGLRALFDSSVGGKTTPVQQEIMELRNVRERGGQQAAMKNMLDLADRRKSLESEFANLFGDQIRKADYNPELDPRDVAAASQREDVVQAWQKAVRNADIQRQTNKPSRLDTLISEFKRDNRAFVDRLRRNADKELNQITGGDQLLEAFNTRLTGDRLASVTDGGLTEERFVEELLKPRQKGVPEPRLRDFAEQYVRDQQIPGIGPVQHEFVPGDVVRATDRGNYGYVQQVGPKSSQVFFRNPDTNAAQTVNLSNDQLKRAFAGNTQEAEAYAHQVTRKVFDDVVKATAETGDVNRAFQQFLGADAPDKLSSKIAGYAEDMRAANAAIYSALEDKGLPTAWLSDAGDTGMQHFPRYVDPTVAKKRTGEIPIARPTFGSMKGRTEETRLLPEYVVNELHRNGRYRGNGAAERIQKDFDEWLDGTYGQAADEFSFGDDAAELGKQKHAAALADWLADRKQGDLYTKDHLDNWLKYQQGAQIAGSMGDAIHDVLKRHAKMDGHGVRLDVAMQRAGLNPEKAMDYFARRHQVDPRTLTVDEDVVRQIRGVTEVTSNPEWADQIGQAVDRFNRAFKTWVTVPFPSFAVRNHTSGQFVNLTSGLLEGPQDLAAYGTAWRGANRLRAAAQKGGDALQDGDSERLRELLAYKVIQPRGFMDIDVTSTLPRYGDPVERIIPGAVLSGDTVRQARTKVAENPLDFPGLRNKVADKARVAGESVTTSGANLNAAVEWQNRVTMYNYLRDVKQWSPEAAAAKVNELQFDYGDLSRFEKDVMRRAMPFYAFTRKAIPQFIETIRQRPGGAVAQTIRATRSGQDNERPVPDWIAQGTSIPLGAKDDGSQSYLTGLGLAHEVPLQFLGDGVRGAGMETLGMLNPLVKGPLEYFTGESFFQRGPMGGRDIDTMDPVIGRILTSLGVQDEDASGRAKPFIHPLVENVATNTPLSRLLTTARTLLDERKYEKAGAFPGDALAMNLLTGSRISDVSPAAQDAVLRDTASALARESGARTYETVYFSKAQIDETRKIDPRRAEQMEAFNALRNLLGRKAKDRKKSR